MEGGEGEEVMRRQIWRPMGGPVALLLVLTVVCPRAGANDKTLVLSSHSLEDPDRFALALSCPGASASNARCFARPCCRDLPPLELELPLEARELSGEQVYYYGEQLLMKGQSLQAAAFLARATELLPSDSFAHGNLAIALHQMGRSKDAVPHFRAAAGLNPAALYFANLGQALWSTGDIEEAIRVLR